mgnify:CR=1 FL=1
MPESVFTKSEKEEIYQSFLEQMKVVTRFVTERRERDGEAPFGQETLKALLYLLEKGEADGFRTGNLDNVCGWLECGEGEHMNAVLCHLDVVPAGPSADWHYPPYELTIADDRIYGRGTEDDKGPLVLVYEILKKLKAKKYPFRRRVRLLIGCAEETTCECMKTYAQKGEIPDYAFTPDGAYPVISGEKGILRLTLERDFQPGENPFVRFSGGTVVNAVPGRADAETSDGLIWHADGVAAHASTPDVGDNAVLKLGRMLREKYPCAVTELLAMLNQESLNINLKDEYSSLTFVPSMIDVTPGYAKITCDIRFPLTSDGQEIVGRVNAAVAPLGFQVKSSRITKPLFIPPQSPLVRTLFQVYRECTGDMVNQPMVIGGGTYAKALPNTVAFGVGFPHFDSVAHTADEYWLIDDISRNIDILAAAIVALDQLDHSNAFYTEKTSQ